MGKVSDCKRKDKGKNIKKQLGVNKKVGGNQVSEEECREEKKCERVSGRNEREENIDTKMIYKLIIDNA